jgi:hypothetical protein
MQPAPQPPNSQRRVQLEIPANLNATYANAVVISQMHSEIVMDFVQIFPNDSRARVQSRIVMTPANAKLFLQALGVNLTRYEQANGEIKLPPQPVTLAEQLFGSIKPPEEDGKPDEPRTE